MISVIIVTHNALELLQTFLPSVMATEYDSFEVLIADNASDDASADWIREKYPSCKIITFTKNFGYCGGNNRAADYASGDILLFLNNDVRVEPDWLRQLDRTFKDPAVSVAQPKIRSHLEPEKFEYAGAAGGFIDLMGYPFCRGRIFGTIEADRGQYDDEIPVFWASGAAFAIRKEVFFDTGRFDERFGFHMEEIDLCWRCLNMGYKIRVSPSSTVYHLGGGSLPAGSSRKTFFNFRNSLQMIWKNATTSWLKRRFILRLLLDGAAGIRALLTGNLPDTIAIIRAHLHFYLLWPGIHRKRKELQKRRVIDSEPEEMMPFSIICRYYILGKKRWVDLFEK